MKRSISSGASVRARRVLCVLECRSSDEAVCARAVELVEEAGGFLTLLAIAPRRFPWANAGPYCLPVITDDERRLWAEAAIARAVAVIPPEISLVAVTEDGKTSRVVRRRIELCAPDVVVLRQSRRPQLHLTVPVIAC